MCGRFSRAADMATLAKRFGIELAEILEVRPRYNLAPSEETPAVVMKGEKKQLQIMKWGITRQWDKAKPPLFIINLKGEKLATGPFKAVLTKRRCLIPADGFYEWAGVSGKKQPFRFTMKDDSIFAFPAIFDDPSPAAKTTMRMFCIFTTAASDLVSPVHHRMPAILPRHLEGVWLDPDLDDPQCVIAMLISYPAEKMKSWAVSTVLNSARIDAPELIKPISHG